MKKPILIVMCGLQGSGKSTEAKNLMQKYNAVIISSDQLRKENPDWTNDTVFKTLYSRVNNLLDIGQNVIIDATNTTIKMRKQIFANVRVDCKKICYIMNTPYNECIQRVKLRNSQLDSHKVPEEVIDKYYKSFEVPFYEEGWNEIILHIHPDYQKAIDTEEVIHELADGFNQNNKHHTQDLGEHLYSVGNTITENTSDRILRKAAYFHDTGKLFTQTYKDGDPNAHYYNHANVGAYGLMCTCGIYDPIFDTTSTPETLQFVLNINKTLDWLFYINYHMLMYNMKTEKSINKWKTLFGEDKFNNLILLNNADKGNHANEEV